MGKENTLSKMLAILNPECFKNKNKKYLNEIITSLSDRNAEIRLTDYNGHATEIVQESTDEYENIIAIGGDGTISEIINGMNLKKQRLGIFPVGCNNGFAKDLGLTSWKQSLDCLEKNAYKEVDLIKIKITDKDGKSREQQIASFCSVGYFNYRLIKNHVFSNIMNEIDKKRKLKSLHKQFKVKLKIEQKDWKEVYIDNIVVSNICNVHGKPVFKNSNLQDDFFHCVFWELNPFQKIVSNLSLIPDNYYTNILSQMEIVFEDPQIAILDGEVISEAKKISFTIYPEKLSCYSMVGKN